MTPRRPADPFPEVPGAASTPGTHAVPASTPTCSASGSAVPWVEERHRPSPVGGWPPIGSSPDSPDLSSLASCPAFAPRPPLRTMHDPLQVRSVVALFVLWAGGLVASAPGEAGGADVVRDF